MARRKNTRFIDPRYFMDEKMERLDEGPASDEAHEKSLTDSRLVGDLKKFYAQVYPKEPSFVALHGDPVGLFLKAYGALKTENRLTGMFKVQDAINKMHELF